MSGPQYTTNTQAAPAGYSGASPTTAADGSGQSVDPSNPWSSLITAGQQIIPGIIGSNAAGSAAGAVDTGINNMITQQQGVLGNVTNLYQPQYQTGVGANANLASTLGLNGAAPDYSLFDNSPGYKFALDQANQAINRSAAAGGNLYSTSTLDSLSKNAAGYASQNYNNYVSQLMAAAGLGQQANSALTQANLTTGNNIGQGLVGQGNANASGILGASSANSSAVNGGLNFLNSLIGGGSGNGTSGGILSKVGSAFSPGGIFGPALDAGGSAGLSAASAAGGLDSIGSGLGSTSALAGSTVDSDLAAAGLGSDSGVLGSGGSLASSLGAGDAGFSAATGVAAGDADVAALGSAVPELSGAGDAAAAGAGSLGAGLAGAAVPLAVAAFGASRQPYQLTAQWWNNFTNGLTKGISGNATYDKTTPPAMQMYSAKNSLYQMLQQAGPGGNLTSSDFGAGGNKIPANIMALAKSYGMLNADGTLNKNWSQKLPVAPSAGNGWGTRLASNTYIDPSMAVAGSQAGPGGRAN